MDERRKLKYEREALRDGAAKRTQWGVLHAGLADRIKARVTAQEALARTKGRGELGPTRSPWRRARKHYRESGSKLSLKNWLRTLAPAPLTEVVKHG
jgi:hypothetical protein